MAVTPKHPCQYNDARRLAMVQEITEAVPAAERGAYDQDTTRIWVFPEEVPKGVWGAAGRIWRLEGIAGFVFGDEEKASAYPSAS